LHANTRKPALTDMETAEPVRAAAGAFFEAFTAHDRNEELLVRLCKCLALATPYGARCQRERPPLACVSVGVGMIALTRPLQIIMRRLRARVALK
jgi:hypothetical protein